MQRYFGLGGLDQPPGQPVVIGVEMGNEYQGYVLEPEADLAQLPLHRGEGLVGVPAGIDQQTAFVSLDEVRIDGQLVELKGKGQLQLMYARENLHGYLPRLKKA